MSASAPPRRPKPISRAHGAPIVVKADGLAAGKGVVVAQSLAEAEAAVDMMFGGGLGEAGAEVVIEEFLDGEEASFFALCDGETAIAAGHGAGSQARLRRRHGPNTGGMGAYSPAPNIDAAMSARVMAEIIAADAAGHEGDGRALQGRALCRADDHRARGRSSSNTMRASAIRKPRC